VQVRPPEAGALAGAVAGADAGAEAPLANELLLAEAEDAPFAWLLLVEVPAPLVLLPLSLLAMRSAVDRRASTPGRGYK